MKFGLFNRIQPFLRQKRPFSDTGAQRAVRNLNQGYGYRNGYRLTLFLWDVLGSLLDLVYRYIGVANYGW